MPDKTITSPNETITIITYVLIFFIIFNTNLFLVKPDSEFSYLDRTTELLKSFASNLPNNSTVKKNLMTLPDRESLLIGLRPIQNRRLKQIAIQ